MPLSPPFTPFRCYWRLRLPICLLDDAPRGIAVRLTKTVFRFIAGCGLLAPIVFGCGGHPAQPAKTMAATSIAANAKAPANYPLIVRIVSRDQTITITAGPHGSLYTAATSNGKILVANATLDQLRTVHPDVYRQVNKVVALDASAVIDCSRD